MTPNALMTCLKQHRDLWEVVICASEFGLKNWYVGAGAVCQTVWNLQHGNEPGAFIKDIDLVYFDPNDLSSSGEQAIHGELNRRLEHLSLPVDLTNQARVHHWYEEEFGFEIQPYFSTEDAIDSWPTTASAIGVRFNDRNEFEVYAPFGLNDLGAMVVKPNKKLITKPIYESKALKWKQSWPKLTITNW